MSTLGRARLDAFASAVLGDNPFRVNRVSRPDELRVDVSAIHGPEFRKLLRRVGDARTGAAEGVLLTGIAGCGKSHLIARLCRWALHDPAGHGVVPVFLHNLQASPERMPRYVLKATMSALSAIEGGSDALEGLRARLAVGDAHPDPLDTQICRVLRVYLDRRGEAGDEDLAEAAIGWLSGDPLDADQVAFLTALSGRTIPPVLPDAAAVERVLVLLCRLLAESGRMLLLCLDQIDNLEVDQVGALTAFLHALLDHASHLLVICSGVTTTMARLREVGISEAAWDRIAQYKVELQEVTPEQARQLVIGRLADFLDPWDDPGIEALRRADPLFPLGGAWFSDRFGDALQFRPRDAITWARDAWEDAQIELERAGIGPWLAARAGERRGGDVVEPAPAARQPEPAQQRTLAAVIREGVGRKVEERRADRLQNLANLPPDTDNLATLLRALLSAAAERPEHQGLAIDPRPSNKRGKSASPFDLTIRWRQDPQREEIVGVVCVPGGHGNATTATLRRVREDRQPLARLVLVTDERRPMRLARGGMGQAHYDALEQDTARPMRHCRLQSADIAQLDAMVSVIGLARVGDLEVEPGRASHVVTETEAVAAMHELDLFRAHPLLRELLAAAAAPAAGPLGEEAVRQAICSYLSWRVGANCTEVAARVASEHGLSDPAQIVAQVAAAAEELDRRGMVRVLPDRGDPWLLWLGGAA